MGLMCKLLWFFQDDRKESFWNDALLVDVRSPEEFVNGHIEGSINLPIDQIISSIHKITLDLEANIVVYCASGLRSSSARKVLIKMGYMNVINGGGVNGVADKFKKHIV